MPIGPRRRILWADDNADMREYVARLLAQNYEVIAVPDGQAALAAAVEKKPDLVLSDVMMPGLDGFGLLRELRADERTRTIPVILLSARAGEGSAVEGLAAGADDYLIKPFSARELLARVRTHLEMARLRREWEVELEARVEQRTAELSQKTKELQEEAIQRRQAEEQFIQSQKMEVVGQLASGVAHDFNNILGVIIGYSDLVMQEIDAGHFMHKPMQEIRHAADRAAGLTKQLLIFSRKQQVEMAVLDLNLVLTGMDKLLRRLIDEHVELTILPGKQIGRIEADSGHIGQVVMNMVVNARDAMPDGGKIIIETSNISFGANESATGILPGDYLMLGITDTGSGMTEEVKARLFEPFFTTKPQGKGTGLGLATCQTIIKQCGGQIRVHSELGKGTAFKVYFPRAYRSLNAAAQSNQTAAVPRGTETLLLVEDEPSVRALAHRVLESQGYNVLRATTGQEGLRVAREHRGPPISMVVTDVIMPQMGGKVMAEWLKATYPNLKILFTSGYTDDTIAHHGVLEPGVAFLQKPYTPGSLSRKVREVLDVQEASTCE